MLSLFPCFVLFALVYFVVGGGGEGLFCLIVIIVIFLDVECNINCSCCRCGRYVRCPNIGRFRPVTRTLVGFASDVRCR